MAVELLLQHLVREVDAQLLEAVPDHDLEPCVGRCSVEMLEVATAVPPREAIIARDGASSFLYSSTFTAKATIPLFCDGALAERRTKEWRGRWRPCVMHA